MSIKRICYQILTIAALAVPFAAYADEKPAETLGDKPTGTLGDKPRAMTTDEPADAVATTTCAPWDGPAIKIQIARHGKLSCPEEEDAAPDAAHYEVRVYKSWAQIKASTDQAALLTRERGSLMDCPGKGQPCKPVENGRIDFFDRGGILRMPMNVMQGMEQSLPFTMRWCEKFSSPCG